MAENSAIPGTNALQHLSLAQFQVQLLWERSDLTSKMVLQRLIWWLGSTTRRNDFKFSFCRISHTVDFTCDICGALVNWSMIQDSIQHVTSKPSMVLSSIQAFSCVMQITLSPRLWRTKYKHSLTMFLNLVMWLVAGLGHTKPNSATAPSVLRENSCGSSFWWCTQKTIRNKHWCLHFQQPFWWWFQPTLSSGQVHLTMSSILSSFLHGVCHLPIWEHILFHWGFDSFGISIIFSSQSMGRALSKMHCNDQKFAVMPLVTLPLPDLQIWVSILFLPCWPSSACLSLIGVTICACWHKIVWFSLFQQSSEVCHPIWPIKREECAWGNGRMTVQFLASWHLPTQEWSKPHKPFDFFPLVKLSLMTQVMFQDPTFAWCVEIWECARKICESQISASQFKCCHAKLNGQRWGNMQLLWSNWCSGKNMATPLNDVSAFTSHCKKQIHLKIRCSIFNCVSCQCVWQLSVFQVFCVFDLALGKRKHSKPALKNADEKLLCLILWPNEENSPEHLGALKRHQTPSIKSHFLPPLLHCTQICGLSLRPWKGSSVEAIPTGLVLTNIWIWHFQMGLPISMSIEWMLWFMQSCFVQALGNSAIARRQEHRKKHRKQAEKHLVRICRCSIVRVQVVARSLMSVERNRFNETKGGHLSLWENETKPNWNFPPWRFLVWGALIKLCFKSEKQKKGQNGKVIQLICASKRQFVRTKKLFHGHQFQIWWDVEQIIAWLMGFVAFSHKKCWCCVVQIIATLNPSAMEHKWNHILVALDWNSEKLPTLSKMCHKTGQLWLWMNFAGWCLFWACAKSSSIAKLKLIEWAHTKSKHQHSFLNVTISSEKSQWDLWKCSLVMHFDQTHCTFVGAAPRSRSSHFGFNVSITWWWHGTSLNCVRHHQSCLKAFSFWLCGVLNEMTTMMTEQVRPPPISLHDGENENADNATVNNTEHVRVIT